MKQVCSTFVVVLIVLLLLVDLGFGAVEDFLAAHCECQHLVLAFVDLDGGNPLDAFGDFGHPGLAVGDAAGEEYGVDLAACDGSQTADFHSYLIAESVDKEFAFLIAGKGFLLDFVSIVGAQISHKTAFGSDHLLELGLGVFATASHFDEFRCVDAAAAGGGEGSETAEGAVHFDNAAVVVDAYADATAHVGDDEVEVFVFLAELTCIEFCRHFLVQAVPDDTFAFRVEVEHGVTADFCEVRTLVDDSGVGDVGMLQTDFACDAVGNKGTKVASVLALDTFAAFLLHEVVDFVSTRLAGTGKASATHDDGNFVSANVMAFQHVEDGTFSVVELVGHLFEFLDFLDGVAEVLGENFGFSFVDGGFC